MDRRGWAGAVALAALGAVCGGCGATASTSTGTASAPSSVGLGPPSGSSASSSSTASVASGAAGGGSAGGSAGGGSAAPLPTRGYGTYELCQGHCSGAVPASLRRPLRLPVGDGGPCPVTLHVAGPVTPSTSTEVGFSTVTASSWLASEVTWRARADYTGPVLIRGGEVGGDAPLGFGEGRIPYASLELLDSGRVSPRVPAGERAWTTYTRIRAAGCYAYQVDGTGFSESITFRAVG